MRYDCIEDEIQHKLTQALAAWRDTGSPDSISIKDAVQTFARTHPTVTEDQFRSAVHTCPFLELDDDQIKLSKEVGDFSPEHPERFIFERGTDSARSFSKSEGKDSDSSPRSFRKFAWILAIIFAYAGYYLSGLGGFFIGAVLGWIIGRRIKKVAG